MASPLVLVDETTREPIGKPQGEVPGPSGHDCSPKRYRDPGAPLDRKRQPHPDGKLAEPVERSHVEEPVKVGKEPHCDQPADNKPTQRTEDTDGRSKSG